MSGTSVVFVVVMLMCSIPFVGIGIYQLNKQEPVTFWSGEEPLKKECVSDVKAFNRKHGLMWILYGCSYLLIFMLGHLMENRALQLGMILFIIIGGLIIMMLYHGHLMKKYVIHEERVTHKENHKSDKGWKIVSVIFTLVAIIVSAIILFMGDVKVEFHANSVSFNSFGATGYEVDYQEIASVTMEKNIDVGHRDFGIGSFKLNAGHFSNQEFGKYNLYSYLSCDSYIVIETKDSIVVVNQEDEEKTEALFKELERCVNHEKTQ